MGLLNQPSDGLPSVLCALVRTLRHFGPRTEDELLALCCPPTLQHHTDGFQKGRHGPNTLNRWTQLGLFHRTAGKVALHVDVAKMPREGLPEVVALSSLLRRLVFSAENNQKLNGEGGELAADFTLSLCWALAQDIFAMPGGAYKYISPLENEQFTSAPYAFQNDTRWNGFRAWAPLLGFGWNESEAGNPILVIDATVAVRDALPTVFGKSSELPLTDLVRRLAEVLPVLDGGRYRLAVEARMARAWSAPQDHEISISLSSALLRLYEEVRIRMVERSDAPKLMLLGRGRRHLRLVSHVVLGDVCNA